MKKFLAFEIYDKMFGAEVLFVGNCTAKQADKYVVKKYKAESDTEISDDACGAQPNYHTKKGTTFRVVWCKDLSFTVDSIGTLAHEIMHLVIRITHDRGISNHPDYLRGYPDETISYMMQFYIEEALKKIKKK